MTSMQRLVLAVFCLPLLVIAGAFVGWSAGFVSGHSLSETVEVWGENGAMLALAGCFAMTPLATLTGTRRIWLRKWLGLVAFVLGALDGLRFFILQSVGDAFSQPFLVFGVVALLAMVPLALTSNRWSMRRLGANWRRLHRLTYVAVAALILHIALIPGDTAEVILPAVLFGPSAVLRVPAIRRAIVARRTRGPATESAPEREVVHAGSAGHSS